jgi:hypothetical protein
VRQLIYEDRLRAEFEGVRIFVPSAVVLATDMFERFLDQNGLRDFAIREPDDAEIERVSWRRASRSRFEKLHLLPGARRLSARRALVEPARGLAARASSPACSGPS